MGLVSVFARPLIGVATDRWGRESVYTVGMTVAAGAVLLVLWLGDGQSFWPLAIYVALAGITDGISGLIIGAKAADIFPTESLGTVMGFVEMGRGAAIFLGPIVAGLMFDLQGDYVQAFILSAFLTLGLGMRHVDSRCNRAPPPRRLSHASTCLFGPQSFVTIPAHERYLWRASVFCHRRAAVSLEFAQPMEEEILCRRSGKTSECPTPRKIESLEPTSLKPAIWLPTSASRRPAPAPACRPVIVVQEAFGVNRHIQQVADGFAAAGYVAVAPALFHRNERNPNPMLGYTPDDFDAAINTYMPELSGVGIIADINRHRRLPAAHLPAHPRPENRHRWLLHGRARGLSGRQFLRRPVRRRVLLRRRHSRALQ